MKVVLSPNPYRDRGLRAAQAAEKILRNVGVETAMCLPFLLEGSNLEFPKHIQFKDTQEELKNADMLVCFGGDGTILHAAKDANACGVPILGVNLGSVGFMAELEQSELSHLSKIAAGRYTVESRMMLDVAVLRDGRQIYTNLGLNEAVIREGPISHVIHLKVSSDGRHLTDIAGDGVIVATPTGSTGYSLSAGGPVVEPVAPIMVVCPICMHNMRFSSYVLSPEHTLTIELERNGRKPVYLFVDESRGFSLRADDKVVVRRSKYVTRLVRLSERCFCETFAQKMLPGGMSREK